MQPLRPSELANVAQPHTPWLWHGYLAPGKVTLLISPPKTGKTTLASHMLARFAQGGQLAGLAVAPARAIVVSEESASDWDARCRQFDLGQNVQFLCRPFQGARPTSAQWFALVASLESLHRREGLDLIVIDPLATLLPDSNSLPPRLGRAFCILHGGDANGGAIGRTVDHAADSCAREHAPKPFQAITPLLDLKALQCCGSCTSFVAESTLWAARLILGRASD
jgi:hypothetical protein